jgi:hypothetical protein
VLDKQLGMLTDHLGIVRHREKDNIRLAVKAADGSVKMVGKQLKPYARLTTKFPDRDDVVEYVPEEDLPKRMAEKKVELSRKYKTIEEIEYTELPTKEFYKLQNSQSSDDVDFGIGGIESFLSTTKMAINYYLINEYEVEWVRPAISTIKGEVDNEITYFFYPNPNHYAVHELGENEVSHIIHIRGIPEERLLYAYVELFNLQNILIRLNMNYGGPAINDTYAFDLLSGKQIDKRITIKLTKPHFEDLALISQANRKEIDARYRRLEIIIQKNQIRKK